MSKNRKLYRLTPLVFILPSLLGLLVFNLFPVLTSLGMAFTNWSLKPGQATQFIGLTNFSDLVGLVPRPGRSTSTAVLGGFYLGCGLAAYGLIVQLWASLDNQRGAKWAAATSLLSAYVLILGPWATEIGHDSLGLVTGALVLSGGLGLLRDAPDAWRPGPGIRPALALASGILLLVVTQGPVRSAYQPRDPRFWSYLYNTLYLLMGIPVTTLGSLALAVLVQRELPELPHNRRLTGVLGCIAAAGACTLALTTAGHPNMAVVAATLWGVAALGLAFNGIAFRTVLFLPTVTSGVALMVVWKAMYNPETGPINQMLHALSGLPIERLPRWLSHSSTAKAALLIMGFWTSVGGTGMLLYLAALNEVPKELIDASRVDGADAWNSFRHVTWPSVAPTTLFLSVMSTIGGLQGGFEQARVMTSGNYDTATLSYYIYTKAFQELDLGYGAAISLVLCALILLATAFNLRFGGAQDDEY